MRVDPQKDVVVDVSSTSSEDSEDEVSVSSTSTPSSSDSGGEMIFYAIHTVV